RFANVVMVLPDGLDHVLPGADAVRAERVQAFTAAPAVVSALGDDVDLLIKVLADVRGPQPAGLAVESHAPGIPQAVGPDLGCGVLAAGARIVLGNAVLLAAIAPIDIDAQDLGEQGLQVLTIFLGVVGGAPVAHHDVQVAVRAETDRAAVMIPERTGEAEKFFLAVGVGLVRVVLADVEPG